MRFVALFGGKVQGFGGAFASGSRTVQCKRHCPIQEMRFERASLYRNDKEVISKAIQIINSKEYDVICIYNQEYDDIMHRTHPKSLLSQRALKHYNQSHKMLLQAIKQSYQNQKTLFATITDHGVHREWYLLGNHGKNIDKDINIIHFYNII